MPHTTILDKTSTCYVFLFGNVSSGNRDISKLLAKECPCYLNSFQSGTFLQEKISPGYPPPHSIIHATIGEKIESSQPLGRALFSVHSNSDSITDWSRGEGRRGSGLHLQLSKASPTESNQGPHLHKAMYSPPYLSISISVYIQCQCKNLKLIS